MRFTFYHWGLHPWAIYSAPALPLAYFHFRLGLPLAPRSPLYPLLGEGIRGAPGHAVDVLCTVGTLFGVATSLELGAAQVNAGFNPRFGMPQGTGPQLILLAGITAVATISVVSGLHRGIRHLSQFNIGLTVAILAFVLIAGPTVFLLEVFVNGVGYYLQKLPFTSLHIAPGGEGGWRARWTLFYWSWWISWSPFVGVFLARISKGRTIREFLTTTLLVPTLGGFLWFSALGDTGIHQELDGPGGLAALVQGNEALALFEVLGHLPLSTPTWALAEGAVAATLLYFGGLNALRTASLTTGLPMAVFLLVAAYGLVRALRVDYAVSGVPSPGDLREGEGTAPALDLNLEGEDGATSARTPASEERKR